MTDAERAKARGMNPLEYLSSRNDLRRDYQQAFDPPDYRAHSALGYGWLMACAAGRARVRGPTLSREFYEARERARLEAQEAKL